MSKEEFEKTSLEFNKLQNDLSTLLSTRQQLETQFQENDIVRKEFESLDDDAKIYKLTGPVLLPQDKAEAEMNVDKRIEFIKKEIERAEGSITTTQAKLDQAREKLIQIRSSLQS
ncbi:tubulin-binding prefolding complex subunit YKE2 [Cyberlindnera jadinii NRRL Y-1542]|uniref:Prefoldin subunit 6 n=1 Tax=Cyberlindnera jadinii (strain ATCC 18201 / CBS 1600 / BCRC 20928 / JCM 3617 / NBRC 0987 / NRRL Y-1542) TaxID=983966 RepID=A0A1E4RWY5_CYBJN|nr:prefoldin subunit 6 [Cyberlindnera jadinii NRRL Y-1542]ODV71802.1 prefoldin subunit 6 [Cyberlindnera jadinii NRRL Y-1542]